MDTTRLTTLYRLAKQLKLPATWLKDEAEAGRIPVLRAGRRILFNPEAVECVLLDRATEMSALDITATKTKANKTEVVTEKVEL